MCLTVRALFLCGQDTLLTQEAPFRSPMARLIGQTMDTLRTMKVADPHLVQTLTENFDKFPDVRLDGAGVPEVAAADSKRKSSKSAFIGYTFRRPKDGGPPVLSSGASARKASPPE